MPAALKVATPATALTVVVPERAPGPLATPIVTAEVSPVAMLPYWSRAVTVKVASVPALPLEGCVPKARWVATSAVMLNAEVEAEGAVQGLTRGSNQGLVPMLKVDWASLESATAAGA